MTECYEGFDEFEDDAWECIACGALIIENPCMYCETVNQDDWISA